MNLLEKVLTHNEHWKHPEAEWSVSQLTGSSNYQRWLLSNGAESNHVTPIENSVNAVLGTGFHTLAEEALKDEDLLLEHSMFCRISGVNISGTADVIEDRGTDTVIGDFKTKGGFQMKKYLRGEKQSEIDQLSLYRYMYHKESGDKMHTEGEIYLVHTGDVGRWGKKDEAELGFKGRLPKYLTDYIPLMSYEEVEEYVEEKANPTDTFDCYEIGKPYTAWRCGYCNISDCEYRL